MTVLISYFLIDSFTFLTFSILISVIVVLFVFHFDILFSSSSSSIFFSYAFVFPLNYNSLNTAHSLVIIQVMLLWISSEQPTV